MIDYSQSPAEDSAPKPAIQTGKLVLENDFPLRLEPKLYLGEHWRPVPKLPFRLDDLEPKPDAAPRYEE